MSESREHRIKEISQHSLELPHHERAAYIEAACKGDPELKTEVKARLERAGRARAYFSGLAQRLGAASVGDPRLSIQEGDSFGKYVIKNLIAEGGMGLVYRAIDTQLHRTVALKFLSPRLMDDGESNERFLREARAAATLNHPHITTIYDVIEYDGISIIVMEYVEGRTLREVITEHLLQPGHSLALIRQLAEGLRAAHLEGIVHRDIKPSNLMVTAGERLKIMDFGLAKLHAGAEEITRTGTTMGTVAYMSPEQVRGETVDHRSDLWSMGVVFYELLAGKRPFRGEYEHAIIYSILNDDLPSIAGIDDQLNNIVAKMLVKDPAQRYQDVSSILEDLSAIDAGRPPEHSKVLPAKKGIGRRMAFLAASIAVLLVVAGIWAYPRNATDIQTFSSLAVLPFENATGDEENEFLSDSFTDAMIFRLGKLASDEINFKVISRLSAFNYKDKAIDPKSVAADLEVESILHGRLTQQENLIVLIIYLIDPRDNSQIWAERYEKHIDQFLDLEEEVVLSVSKQLMPELGTERQLQIAKSYTESSETYRLYLRGRVFMNQATSDGSLKAIEQFEKAIEVDSTFALAYAGLAETYLWVSTGYANYDLGDALENAEKAARRALDLDGSLAEVHTALGGLYFARGEWDKAKTALLKALEINPNLSQAHEWYSFTLLPEEHQIEQGIYHIQKAHEIDPENIRVANIVGWPYEFAREYEKAIGIHESVLEIDSTYFMAHYNLGYLYAITGDYDKGRLALQQAIRYSNGADAICWASLAFLEATHNNINEAQTILNQLLERKSTLNDVPSYGLAWVYIGLNEYDNAINWLEDIYDNGNKLPLRFLNIQPIYDPLRSHPRFQQLVAKVKTMN